MSVAPIAPVALVAGSLAAVPSPQAHVKLTGPVTGADTLEAAASAIAALSEVSPKASRRLSTSHKDKKGFN